jgi:hypothetical protein
MDTAPAAETGEFLEAAAVPAAVAVAVSAALAAWIAVK